MMPGTTGEKTQTISVFFFEIDTMDLKIGVLSVTFQTVSQKLFEWLKFRSI